MEDAVGEGSRGFNEDRVIEQIERLERRVASGAGGDAFFARGCVEGEKPGVDEGALPPRVHAAAVAGGAVVGGVGAFREIEEIPVAVGLIGFCLPSPPIERD